LIEGFWIVQFDGLQGNGAGVAVFIRGKVFGGDSGSTYIGTYEVTGRTVKAEVRVHNYVAGVQSIIGIEGDYDLRVVGDIEDGIIRASGSAPGKQVAGMALRLTRTAALPE